MIDKIIQTVEKDFEECRQMYADALSHENPLLNEILSFIGKRQGKMMRPLLVLLVGRLLTDKKLSLAPLAVAYEFFHTASLVHDDVVDDSNERRGQASVNCLFNNKRAVLAGDYLLSRALHGISIMNNPVLVDIMSEAAACLASGELLQLNEDTEQNYIRIIENKTAALFRACAESGAVAVGASQDDRQKMRELGRLTGILFQVKDDLLDKEKEEKEGNILIEKYMKEARDILNTYPDNDKRKSLEDYIEFVVNRNN